METSVTGGKDTDTTADDITQLRSSSGKCSSAVDTPRVLKQRFVLEDKLGSGGMGTVYRARDLRKVEARDKNPYVAIKVLNNDFRAHPDAFIALQREASKSQAIAHPNIVSIFDFDKDGDIPYMTMELLEGKELAELLKQYPNGLPDALLWPCLEGICAGLKRAHDAGIIHADFKPGNVLVTGGGVAKILDFGIARAVRTHQYDGEDTVFDPAKLAALTPPYASREMLEGEAPVAADDVYSFAVVAYLMITGRHPYNRVRADEAVRQRLVAERPRRLTARQWRVLERALSFDRASRPQSIDEVIAKLLRPSPARPWLGAAAALVLLAAAMFLWLGPPNVERAAVARDAVANAQSDRVEALLREPVLDDRWHDQLARELDALAPLLPPETIARVRDRVLDFYLQQMRSSSPERSLELLGHADRLSPGGRFAAGHALAASQFSAALAADLEGPDWDNAWIASVDALLAGMMATSDVPADVARMRRAAAEAFAAKAEQRLAARDPESARVLLEAAQRTDDASPSLAGVAARVAAAESEAARTAADLARVSAARALDAALAEMTSAPCQRLEISRTFDQAGALEKKYPTETKQIDARVNRYVTDCAAAIGRDDPERALAIRDVVLQRYPSSPIKTMHFDPCDLTSLVGKGTQSGRSGFCVDPLARGGVGPRLVIVPIIGGRLAVAKYETSWSALAPYCDASHACAAANDSSLPAVGIGIDVAEGFASWLSSQTGRRYRLPTVAEWHAFAAGEPDPNRNCIVREAGVTRGGGPTPVGAGAENPFGIVNLYGNVREWARDETGLRAVGGSFADPIAVCSAKGDRPHDGSADAYTGFRLVREVP